MQKEKLLILADFLDKLPEEKFYIGSYVQEFDERNRCGSVCCAVGWLPAIFPEFYWQCESTGYYSIEYTPTASYGFTGVEDFFEIRPDDSQFLFMGIDYPSTKVRPQEVAERIRKFVE